MNLSVDYLGINFENPFVLASAPPTANADMISRAFEAGWAGAVIKTISKDPVKNVKNRFASNRLGSKILAFENIELVSDRSADDWYKDIKTLKERFPTKVIIGSVMSDASDSSKWLELTRGCQEAGADLVELNFSCPHGHPERGQGAAIGQSAELAAKIVKWLKDEKNITVPLIPKLSAAVADISYVGEAVAGVGADGLCAINTYPSLMGFDLRTLEPKASVGGYTTAGGYSGPGLKPIALRCVRDLATNPGLPIMASGGISSGFDTAEFLLLGAPIAQVCTAVMLEGYSVVEKMSKELAEFMSWHNFSSIKDFLGKGVEKIRSYSDLSQDYLVKAKIDEEKCVGCGKCFASCRDSASQAIKMENKLAKVDFGKCIGCSLCYQVCPASAVKMAEM